MMHPFMHGTRRRLATVGAGVFLFISTLAGLFSLGLVPDYVDGTGSFSYDGDRVALSALPTLGRESVSAAVLKPLAAVQPALEDAPPLSPLGTPVVEEVRTPVEPARIVIHGVAIDLPVLNPQSTDVAVLDDALLSGAVRYPLSARLNEEGNVFIFGHSSHLPVVKNQMFKAFNALPELQAGDTIKLTGGGEEHVYRVTSVRQTDAAEELIDLSADKGKRLTLSTCDSFTSKSARWVVEAAFVGSYAVE